MALDIEREIVRHQQGWAGFAKLLFFATAGIIVILGLMALTLL